MYVRKTKIVATVGPSSDTKAGLRALLEAGANVLRLNMSQGAHDRIAGVHRAIRELETELGRPVAILGDLQGPKIRCGRFANGEGHDLEAGQPFTLDLDEAPGDAVRVGAPHPEIFAALEPGADILINDGAVRLKVETCSPEAASCRVVVGGRISDRKGVNLPDVDLPLAALTGKDREDLEFLCDLGIDWLALSFVQRADDVAEAAELARGRARLIAKIEKPNAVRAFDDILDASDGVMVARGDLGVEMPVEAVPPIQKRLVHRCRQVGKPVIVATQMLESMVSSPVPTRAEVNDVATAIYDGADAVMLSAESAAGAYPREAVETMVRVAESIETDDRYLDQIATSRSCGAREASDAITAAAREISEATDIAAICCHTRTGATALRAAQQRPAVPIVAVTSEIGAARRLALVWGVEPDLCAPVGRFRDAAIAGAKAAQSLGIAPGDASVVVTAGVPINTEGATKILRIVRADRSDIGPGQT